MTATPDRRTVLADAALELVADGGMRALTHRAVDARAGVAPGSTSAYFRTREALIIALVTRIAALHQQDIADLGLAAGGALMGGSADPPSPAVLDHVARQMATLTEHLVTTARRRTLARYACVLETAYRPALREILVHGDAARAQTSALLAWAGAPEPDRRARLFVAAMDGLILDRVLNPPAGQTDPEPMEAAVRRLLTTAIAR